MDRAVRARVGATVAALVLFVPACDDGDESQPSPGAAGTEAGWSYEGDRGPERWGELSQRYAVCSDGKEQSPIDIVDPARDGQSIESSYRWSSANIVDTGHSVQVNLDEGGTLKVGGRRYDLAQFHFHAPSEHKVDGRSYPMEVHLVHRTRDEGRLAVVGAFVEQGGSNDVVARFLDDVPAYEEKERELSEPVKVQDLLSDSRRAYVYDGSLTTPPCAEGVKWVVLSEPVEMSKRQIEALKEIHNGNARPVQPLNERQIIESDLAD